MVIDIFLTFLFVTTVIGSDAGTYCSSYGGSGECIQSGCNGGYYCPGDNNQYQCPAGTYGPGSTSSCSTCGEDTYSGAGASSCAGCGGGSYTNTGQSYCVPCNSGYYFSNMNCYPCWAGTYASGRSCINCAAGTISGATAASCQACAAGYFSGVAATSCSICPIGTYSGSGAGSCTSCSPGSWNNETHAPSCTNCIAGYANPNTGSTSIDSCIICQPGTYSLAGSGTCTPCPAGKFQDLAGQSTCNNCAKGYFQNLTGQTSCNPCFVGTFQGLEGQPGCNDCPIGSFTNQTAQLACINCTVGYFQNQTKQTSCIICPLGTYQGLEAQGSCNDCAVGKYAPTTGLAACLNCSAGKFQNLTKQSECLICPVGTFQSLEAQTACIDCALGTYNNLTGQPKCFNCSAGWFQNQTKQTFCYTCLSGTYQSKEAQTSCIDCPIGKYNNLTGQATCLNCSKGWFQNQTKQTFCYYCLNGTYQNLEGQGGCIDCAIGTYNNLTGQSMCVNCQKGMFQSLTRQTACLNCTYGYYQNYPGQSSCFTCKPGTVGPNLGMASCNQCPAGYYQKLEAQTTCLPCTEGLYQNYNGSASCTQCKPGSYQDLQAKNACKLCPIMTYNPNMGAVSIQSCLDCAVGYYNLIEGQGSCIKCSRKFCGACQLENRTLCKLYDGLCWKNFSDPLTNTPTPTTDCLKVIAPICYNIWKVNGTTNAQCADFTTYLDFTKMKIKPIITSAQYSEDGTNIVIKFNNDIYKDDFTDCTNLFTKESLKLLPSSKTGTWQDSRTLLVAFEPTATLPTKFTFNNNSLTYNYIFAQEYVPNITITIKLPPFNPQISVTGLTTISECDNLELCAVMKTKSIFPIIFMWNISFIQVSEDLDRNGQTEAETFFKTFSNWTTTMTLSIPNKYLNKDSILSVKLIGTAANFESNSVTSNITVTILENIPKAKFSNKGSLQQELDGSDQNVIPLQLGTKVCTKSGRRLLAKSGRRLLAKSQPMKTKVDFQIFSGATTQVMAKSLSDTFTESALNLVYNKYKTLSIHRLLGFQYGKFYKLVMTITDTKTKIANADTTIISFFKPPIKAIIDSIGSVVSLSNDIIINGDNSQFPQSTGDFIQYKWSCQDAVSYESGGSCSCPIIARSLSMMPRLKIAKKTLVNLCKYTFSLSVSATLGSYKRTATNQTEFLAFGGDVEPVTGKFTKGHMTAIKDVYFSFALAYKGKDTDLKLNWTLVEISSQDPQSTLFYSEKNGFIYKYFQKIGFNMDSSMTKDDKAIPSIICPTYITPTTSRVLGVDQRTLFSLHEYIFGVTVTYPTGNSSFLFVSITTPQFPRLRILTVTPDVGTAFLTGFSAMFVLPLSTDIDKAQYQIYRKDCPSNENSSAVSLTQVITQLNVYSLFMAQGNKSCNYQVEVILRAIEFDDYIEMSNIITVNPSETPSTELAAGTMEDIKSNNGSMPADQAITTISTVSSVPLPENSTASSGVVDSLLGTVSKLDAASGGIMDVMSDAAKSKLLNTTTTVMGNIVSNQGDSVNLSQASSMSSKVSSYISSAQGLPGGSDMIPNSVSALSGVASVGADQTSNSSLFASIKDTVGSMSAMKINESQPGAVPYSLSTKSLEMIVKKNYGEDFNKAQNTSSEKGNAMQMPAGLADTFAKSVKNVAGAANSTVTVGVSMQTMENNPYGDVKKNSAINTSMMANSSESGVSPSAISQIYNDLSSGKMKVADNMTTKQTPAIVEVALSPSVLQKSGDEQSSGSNIQIPTLPAGSQSAFTFPGQKEGENNSESIALPMIYLPQTKTWTNQGCNVNATNFSQPFKVYCNHMGIQEPKKTKASLSIKSALSITIDIMKNVLSVLAGGNYAMLFSFGSFANASALTYCVAASVVTFLALVGILSRHLHNKDMRDCFDERVKTLYKKFMPDDKPPESGIIYDAFSFLSNAKKKGMENAMKGVNKQPEDQIQSERESPAQLNTQDRKRPNGFTVLTKHEEKELADLFKYVNELEEEFTKDEIFERAFDEIMENRVLSRITQARMDDLVVAEPTFCTILMAQHPYINAIFQPDLKTPRPIKVLAIASTLLGQLFVTGFFFDAKDDTPITDVGTEFVNRAAIVGLAAALLVIPLKIILALFLAGRELVEGATRKELDEADARLPKMRRLGYFLIGFWVVGSGYGITMFIMNFKEAVMVKWLTTFFGSFFIDVIFIFHMKVGATILIGLFLMKIAKYRFILMCAAGIAGKCINVIMAYFQAMSITIQD